MHITKASIHLLVRSWSFSDRLLVVPQTLGGIGYAEGATFPDNASGWGPGGPGNITRNASGHLQVDPVRFPGGNEGMRKLTDAVRALGFRWGHCEYSTQADRLLAV